MKLTDDIPTDEQTFAYLTDVSAIKLDDSNMSWLHAASLGSYKHPLYGKIDFTKQKITKFVQNLKNGVRGIDIAIDYGHRSGQEAAGWVRDAESRANGLWLLVEWTEKAAAAIRNKEYRYFSPEFARTYTDPKTNEVHSDVLLGGGLTNRPFLKDLIPVNLSEVYDDVEDDSTQGTGSEEEDNSVNEFQEKLRKQLGLPEDATDEQILAAANKPTNAGGNDNPQMSELIAQVTALTEQNAKLIAGRRIDGVNVQLKEWEAPSDKNMKFALPPAVHDKVQTLLLSENEGVVTQFTEVVNEILQTGLVPLSEHKGGKSGATDEGGKQGGSDEGEPNISKFEELVITIQNENKDMSTADALEEAARRDPVAFEEYREASYTFKESD